MLIVEVAGGGLLQCSARTFNTYASAWSESGTFSSAFEREGRAELTGFFYTVNGIKTNVLFKP